MLALPPEKVDVWLSQAIKWVVVLLVIVSLGFGGYYGYSQYKLSKQSTKERLIEEARQVIRKQPRNPDARVRLGVLYLQQGKLDEAIVRFKEALEIAKDHQEALIYLGIAYMNKGQKSQALEYFNKEIKYYKNTGHAKANLYLEQAYYYGGVVLWKQKKYDEAINYLKSALEIKKTGADTYLVLGRVYMDKGSYDKSEACFKQALKFDPRYVDAYYGLGLIYEKKGDKTKAIEQYREALKYRPDFNQAQDALNRLTGE